MVIGKEQAIIAHRNMYNWLADKAEETGLLCDETHYLSRYAKGIPYKNSYLCQYAKQQPAIAGCSRCVWCPLNWGSKTLDRPCEDMEAILDFGGLYSQWRYSREAGYTEEYIKLARQIANLPERVCEYEEEVE